MLIAGSPQTPALGSAVAAAVTAGSAAGGYDSWTEAQQRMTTLKEKRFSPQASAHAVYDELYGIYRELHDAFGGRRVAADLGTLMKRLLDVKDRAVAAPSSTAAETVV
jgi:L-ribulokinase